MIQDVLPLGQNGVAAAGVARIDPLPAHAGGIFKKREGVMADSTHGSQVRSAFRPGPFVSDVVNRYCRRLAEHAQFVVTIEAILPPRSPSPAGWSLADGRAEEVR